MEGEEEEEEILKRKIVPEEREAEGNQIINLTQKKICIKNPKKTYHRYKGPDGVFCKQTWLLLGGGQCNLPARNVILLEENENQSNPNRGDCQNEA